MRAAEILPRVLYFGLLLLAAVSVARMPNGTAAPGMVFAILAVWAHAAARIIGVTGLEKGLLFLETLPFFGFACIQLGKQDTLPALLTMAVGAAAGAGILAGEALAVKGKATFTSSLGVILACCLAGFGLVTLPVTGTLGLALVVLTAAGYGLARRAHA